MRPGWMRRVVGNPAELLGNAVPPDEAVGLPISDVGRLRPPANRMNSSRSRVEIAALSGRHLRGPAEQRHGRCAGAPVLGG